MLRINMTKEIENFLDRVSVEAIIELIVFRIAPILLIIGIIVLTIELVTNCVFR